MENQKSIPNGIKIISVVFYVIFAISLVYLIAALILSSIIIIAEGFVLPHEFIIQFIGSLIVTIFCFFTAKGLRKLKSWARISAIVLASAYIIEILYFIVIKKAWDKLIYAIPGLSSIFIIARIIPLLLSIFIIVYLGFVKKAKETFRENYERTKEQKEPQKESINKIENKPLLIKIVSIAHYIYTIALPSVFIGYLGKMLREDPENGIILILFGIFIVGGIIIFMALYFFIARGLWKLKNWARITTIVLSSLVIAYVIQSAIIKGNLGININSIIPILLYSLLIIFHIFTILSLTVPKKVRETFKENK